MNLSIRRERDKSNDNLFTFSLLKEQRKENNQITTLHVFSSYTYKQSLHYELPSYFTFTFDERYYRVHQVPFVTHLVNIRYRDTIIIADNRLLLAGLLMHYPRGGRQYRQEGFEAIGCVSRSHIETRNSSRCVSQNAVIDEQSCLLSSRCVGTLLSVCRSSELS